MSDRVQVQFPVRDIYLGRSTQPGHPFVGSKGRYDSCVGGR